MSYYCEEGGNPKHFCIIFNLNFMKINLNKKIWKKERNLKIIKLYKNRFDSF